MPDPGFKIPNGGMATHLVAKKCDLGSLGVPGPASTPGQDGGTPWGPVGPWGPKSIAMGAAQKMNPPQKIALFVKMAPRGPPWAPQGAWAPHPGPLGPQERRKGTCGSADPSKRDGRVPSKMGGVSLIVAGP